MLVSRGTGGVWQIRHGSELAAFEQVTERDKE